MREELQTTSADQVDHLELRSEDIASSRRADLLRLFPEAASEDGVIDVEQLRRALGDAVEAGKERFGMTWPGKADCFRTIQTPSTATLLPLPEESVAFETTKNVVIEGDNLEVLKLLQKAYLGRVKMIYIDPPYNTGNDFIYPDNFAESLQTYLAYTGQTDAEGRKFTTNPETSGRFHSRWLTMMFPRLYLGRNLLREDGVIFISIDDHEVANLKRLCDEVFGEENMVATFIWQHSVQPKGYTETVSVHHNYILCYRRSDAFELSALERTAEHNRNYSNPDNDPRGPWRAGDVRNALFRPNLRYDIRTPSGKVIPPPANGWRWSKETLEAKIREGEIIFANDESRIVRKIYLSTVQGRAAESIWFGAEVGTTRDAAAELKKLFDGDLPFDTAKPTKLIMKMLAVAGVQDDDLVMDFFAGSGATGHAVLLANRNDDGKRRFVLVQLPEPAGSTAFKTIADITRARVRRAASSMTASPLDSGQLDLGFRAFQLAESNFEVWDAAQSDEEVALVEQLEAHVEHVRPDRSDRDLLFEILLKSGFSLDTTIKEVLFADAQGWSVADGALIVFLHRPASLDQVRSIADAGPVRVVMLDEAFAGKDQLKANAAQIFKSKGISFKTV